MIKDDPAEYGVTHHTQWRVGQLEAVKWAREGGIRILEAPTGSGKTATARAFGNGSRTVALCRTKFLQRDNYEHGYGFVPLYGRSNYRCQHPKADMEQTADQCFHRTDMRQCSVYNFCEYVRARDAAKGANYAVLNYALWMYQREKWGGLGAMVLDEAHQLSDLTIEYAGLRVSEKMRREFNLPPFEMLLPGSAFRAGSNQTAEERTDAWIAEALKLVKARFERLKNTARTRDELQEVAELERLSVKLTMTHEALAMSKEGWYVRSLPSQFLHCVPLTARYHFGRMFLGADNVLVMSATIGDPATFAKELGIARYESRTVPSPFPAVMRQVLDLKAPRIGQSSEPKDYAEQARLIYEAIKREADPSWCGLILTTRKQEAHDLAARLARLGLGDRIWSTTTTGTENIVTAWEERKARIPGSIFVTHALWEGFDGLDEKILIVTKVPYANIGDEYEKARMMYDGTFFLQRAAWQLEQGLGRTRRGRPEDYDMPGKPRAGLVAIADGNYTRIKKYLSRATLEAITEWR